jgi:hypothetical protein
LRLVITILFVTFFISAQAQDSLKLNLDTLKLNVPPTKVDTVLQKVDRVTNKADSLVRSPLQFGQKFISKTKNKIDSLKGKKPRAELELDTLKTFKPGLRNASKLPDYTRVTDSLNLKKPDLDQLKPEQLQTGQGKVNEAKGKVGELNSDVNEKLNTPLGKVNDAMGNLSKEAGGQGNLPDNLNVKAGNVNLPSTDLNSKLPDLKTPDVGEIRNDIKNPLNNATGDVTKKKNELTSEISDIREKGKDKVHDLKPTDKINKIKSSSELQKAKDGQQDVLKDVDKAKGYSQDAKEISKGNIDKVNTVKSDINKRVSEQKELTDATKDLKMMEEQKKQLALAKNQEEFRKQTIARAKTVVTQQFAAQQQKIASSVAKVSEYHSKLGTIQRKIKDLPARPRREKRPPLIERFFPGVTLQVQKGQNWMADVNPTLRFRVRSIFSVGGGWNERIVFDNRFKTFSDQRVFGPRATMEFSIRKGLWLKLDAERMNAFVPVAYSQPDLGTRKWVWSNLAGFRKDFSISSGLRGNVQFMYKFYNPKIVSPYLTRFNVRFGFEIPLKKQKSSKAS